MFWVCKYHWRVSCMYVVIVVCSVGVFFFTEAFFVEVLHRILRIQLDLDLSF